MNTPHMKLIDQITAASNGRITTTSRFITERDSTPGQFGGFGTRTHWAEDARHPQFPCRSEGGGVFAITIPDPKGGQVVVKRGREAQPISPERAAMIAARSGARWIAAGSAAMGWES